MLLLLDACFVAGQSLIIFLAELMIVVSIVELKKN